MQRIVEGLNILLKYDDNKSLYLSAEHDEIYVWGAKPVSEEDDKKLTKLGFHYDEEEQTWARFV